jgi:hypothetical protein
VPEAQEIQAPRLEQAAMLHPLERLSLLVEVVVARVLVRVQMVVLAGGLESIIQPLEQETPQALRRPRVRTGAPDLPEHQIQTAEAVGAVEEPAVRRGLPVLAGQAEREETELKTQLPVQPHIMLVEEAGELMAELLPQPDLAAGVVVAIPTEVPGIRGRTEPQILGVAVEVVEMAAGTEGAEWSSSAI